MEDNSIDRYKEILKQYQSNQDSLTDLGLPEPTENPVQDMIDNANVESKELDAEKALLTNAKKEAQNLVMKLEADNDPLNKINLSLDKKDRVADLVDKSQVSGSIGKEGLDSVKSLTDIETKPSSEFDLNQQNQDMLTDLGLPEPTDNPIQDMIANANVREIPNTIPEQPISGPIDESVATTIQTEGVESKPTVLQKTPVAPTKTPEAPNKTPDSPEISKADKYEALLQRFNELKNSGLSEAKKDRAMQEAIADISEGVSQFGAAYAGGGLTQIKADTGIADSLRKRAQRGFKEAKDERNSEIESAKYDIERASTQDKRDYDSLNLEQKMASLSPDSKISKQMRLILKSKFGKDFKDIDFDSMSANDADKFIQRMGQFSTSSKDPEMADLRRRLTEAKIGTEGAKERYYGAGADTRKDTLDERVERDRSKYQDRKNKLLKEIGYREAKSGFKDVDFLLEDARGKGGQSLSALGTRLAKALGEKGTLTDADVIRYLQMPSLAGATKDEAVKQFTDKLSGASYKNIKRMIDGIKGVMDDKRKEVESEVVDEYISSRSGSEAGITKAQAYKMLAFETPEALVPRDSKIENYAKQYKMTYKKAEQLLRSRGYGKK